jgi:hypothetical protein
MAFDSEPKLWQKKKPRPTIARRTGRHTDLASPEACEDDGREEVVPSG